jgi:hypothetical protein
LAAPNFALKFVRLAENPAAAVTRCNSENSIRSTLMRSAHHLHGVLDVTPFLGLFSLAFALASQRIPGCLRDGSDSMLLEHLPRDGVDLRLGRHLALPVFPQSESQERFRLVLRLP